MVGHTSNDEAAVIMPTTAYPLIILAALIATAAALVILNAAEQRRAAATPKQRERLASPLIPLSSDLRLDSAPHDEMMLGVGTRTAYLSERVAVALSASDYRWLHTYAIHSLTIRDELAPAVATTLTHLLSATSDHADGLTDGDTPTPNDDTSTIALARVDADDLCSWLRNAQEVRAHGFSPYAVGTQIDVERAHAIANRLLDVLYPGQADPKQSIQTEHAARIMARDLADRAKPA